jgi:hypothetical protein
MDNTGGNGGSSPMVGIIIFVIVLLVLGVGGYFGYTKWYKPRICNNKAADTTLNIASWIYDDKTGNCVANSCADTYTLTAGVCILADQCPTKASTDTVATWKSDGSDACVPSTCKDGSYTVSGNLCVPAYVPNSNSRCNDTSSEVEYSYNTMYYSSTSTTDPSGKSSDNCKTACNTDPTKQCTAYQFDNNGLWNQCHLFNGNPNYPYKTPLTQDETSGGIPVECHIRQTK